MLRLFAAIAVPGDVSLGLQALQTGLPGARWRPVEALHITLSFFGEMNRRQAEDLDGELSRVTARPFDVTLSGVGEFGHAHQSDTIWASVETNETLTVLAGRCEAAARRAGLPGSARAYRPHVTLAYLKASVPSDRVAEWIRTHNLKRFEPFRVDRFGLYSSRLSPEGSEYELEREYVL